MLDGVTCGNGECVYQTGEWEFPARVTITVEPPAAAIYYTTDGSQPSTASRRYTEPFDLLEGGSLTTVRAVGVLQGYKNSRVSSALYQHRVDSGGARKDQGMPSWVPIVIGVIAGLLCVCCMVAAYIQMRLLRIKRKIADDEANLKNHHHLRHGAPGGGDGIAVHVHTHTHSDQGPGTFLAEGERGSGILRPITESQLVGIQVEKEVHEGADAQRAMSHADLMKVRRGKQWDVSLEMLGRLRLAASARSGWGPECDRGRY